MFELSVLTVLLGIFFVLFLFILWSSVVIVRGNEIALLERKYLGKSMPQGRVVAMSDEIGIQARILGPGLKFLFPLLYKVRKLGFTTIAENEIGIIESIDGSSIPPGKIFAKVIESHDSFQDGEAFLKNGGEKGPQITFLPPGTYRINPYLFKVKKERLTSIKVGQIGTVTAVDGKEIDAGRLLAKKVSGHDNFEKGDLFLKNGGQRGPQAEILKPGDYRINTDLFKVSIFEATQIPSGKVGLITALDGEPLPTSEYVAKSITGHDDYQNVEQFLSQKGQRGPQFDVLKPGTYYINPLMFTVEVDAVAKVERGQVAVVVSNVGKEPEEVVKLLKKDTPEEQENLSEEEKDFLEADETKELIEKVTLEEAQEIEKRLSLGIERYVVPSGYRGIQREVAGPGIYYLNRRAYMAYVIDTTNITVDWDDDQKTKFDPLRVVSKDGFEISVSVKVIMRVRPDQAPYMVAKIGSIENLISHVIHPMIDSSFRNQASSTSAMNFMQDRQEEQKKAEDRARTELERYHVECVSVLICQIKLPQELMDTQTKKIIAQQEMTMFTEMQKAEETRIKMEKTKATAGLQPELVQSEINLQIAEQNKKKAIVDAEAYSEATKKKAEGDANAIEVKGKAEGAKILAIGDATAQAYEKQKKAIGEQGIISIEIAKQIAEGKVKVTPDFLIQGGDNLGGILSGTLLQNMQQKINLKQLRQVHNALLHLRS